MDTVFGKLRFKRRPSAGFPMLEEGEPGFNTDTSEVFIGSAAGNVPIGNPPVLPPLLADLVGLSVVPSSLFGRDLTGDVAAFPISVPGGDLIDDASFDDMINSLGGGPYTGAGGLMREDAPRLLNGIAPDVDGTGTLGTAALRFPRVYLTSGGIIDFSNGGYLITHSTGNIDFNGSISVASAIGTVGLTASLSVISPLFEPITNGGGTVGSTSFGFSALHLSTGGVINIAAGNWVATHTSGVLTVGTGDLRITNPGTNAASVLTVGGTQPLMRPVYDKGGALHNVKAYGAIGDGVANDTASIQAALDACKAAGGGKVFVPTGTYKITTSLVWNVSAIANETTRLILEGDGVSSCLFMIGVADELFDYVGNPSWPQGHLVIRNLKLLGDVTTGSVGIRLRGGLAWNSIEHVVIYAFNYGLDFADVDQTNYFNMTIRNCVGGGIIRAAVSVTSANSHHFFGCTIGNNSVFGLWITHANSIDFFGGSIQYNSTVGAGAGNFGVLITEAGDGYGQINFVGVAFEGNGGLADFISDQSTQPCTVNFVGCSFTRTAAFGPTVGYAVTNIWAMGNHVDCFYSLSGNTFRGDLAGYTPSAGRPNITMTNPNAVLSDDGTNLYTTTVEAPTWRGTARFPRAQAWDSQIYQATLTTDVNDYDCGLYPAIIAVQSNALHSISGIIARAPGSLMILVNIGANLVTLLDQSVTSASAAANRFMIGTSRVLNSGDGVLLFYDGANAKWCVCALGGQTILQAQQGWVAWTPVVFPAGGAYSVITAAGHYHPVGQTIWWRVRITFTNIGTGTGKANFIIPVGNFRADNCGVGIDVNVTGKAVTALGLVTQANYYSLQMYDNTSGVANGVTFVLSGCYEIN